MIRKATAHDAVTATLYRVSFLAHVPGAMDVRVTGDFTDWSADGITLDALGGDQWHVILTLTAGEHEYRLVVDGRWADHEECRARVPNGFGSENCVLVVA